MKRFALLVLVCAAFFSTGCATPVYSSKERGRQIARNWGFEWQQLQDDVDHALLLRPMGHLTMWELR